MNCLPPAGMRPASEVLVVLPDPNERFDLLVRPRHLIHRVEKKRSSWEHMQQAGETREI